VDVDVELDLKPPFSTYFDAQNAHDVDGMLACFSEGAKVRDEGRDMLGRVAIRAWMNDTTRKYHPTISPIRVARRAERTIVTAQISGTFPGSPIEVRYRFTTSGKKIARLEIG
jgi:hypothetical protein